MIEWFAHGRYAIVAGGAVAHDTGVVIFGANECRGVMADGAVQRSGYMCYRLARGVGAVVTGRAIVNDTSMIEYRC